MQNKPANRRWFTWAKDRRISCKAGHHLPNTFSVDGSASVRCSKWLGAENRECGNWQWLLAIQGGGFIVADVSLDEIEALKKLTTPTDRVDYLGIFNG